MPAANATQKQTAISSRRSRERMARPADDDDRERERHPGRHRPPPELERVGAAGAEQQEAEDEPEVRRVEDVAPAELDHVLREQRHGRGAGEDPPAVQAPPVPVLRARHAQHERDAVPGQQRARRPHDHALAAERDPDLEHRAREQRDEDLGDREPEAERHLAKDLERDDHRRQVEARIAAASAAEPDTSVPRIRIVGRPATTAGALIRRSCYSASTGGWSSPGPRRSPRRRTHNGDSTPLPAATCRGRGRCRWC